MVAPAQITRPTSPGNNSDPENMYLAGCQWLKDGLLGSDSSMPTIVHRFHQQQTFGRLPLDMNHTRDFLPVGWQRSNVKRLAASAQPIV